MLQELFTKLGSEINIFTVGCIYKRGVTPFMSIHGKVTDFQVWSKVLEEEKLKRITSCQDLESGNLLSWDSGAWYLNSSRGTGRREMMELEEEVCRTGGDSYHLVPHRDKFQQSLHMCNKLSGQLVSHHTKENFTQILTFMTKKAHLNLFHCGKRDEERRAVTLKTWLASHDTEEEGVFRNFFTDRPTQYLPWAPERPYVGGTRYNCMVLDLVLEQPGPGQLYLGSTSITDEECEVEFCSLCRVENPVRRMTVRGLCPLSIFDRVYYYTINEQGIAMYSGKRTSVIFYDTELFSWVWYDRKNNKSMAVSYASEDSLLIGVHDVDFSEVVDDKCYKGGSRVKRIKLTSCGEGEFTCTDGQCIDIEQRCDQTSNCQDESDEENCGILFMKDNYNQKIPPFQFDKIKQENIPVNVNVSMSVIDIIKIKEVDHVYTLKYRLTLVWYDYRLKYYNLKQSQSLNALALHEVEKLWIPFLVFDNTENNEATRGTSDTEITLAREGEFVRSEDHVVEEINIFDGASNRITFEQVYTKTFKCVYKLHIYPFDRQV